MKQLVVTLAGACLLAGAAEAQQILSVAVSPDGSRIVAAGDNRTVYNIDSEKMTVTGRRYFEDMVEEVVFSADGKRLFMRDDEEKLSAVDALKFKPVWTQTDVDRISYLPAAGKIVGLASRYDGAALTVYDAETGAPGTRIELGDVDAEYMAVSDDAARAVVLSRYQRSDTEESKNPPSDMKGFEKHHFRQQHDGYTTNVMEVDLGAGSFDSSETWYRTSYPSVTRFVGEKALFLGDAQDSALIAPGGEAEMLDLGEDYFSMATLTRDGTEVVQTNGAEVRFRPLDPSAAGNAPVLDAGRAGGPAERATAMAEAEDGTLYIATSAYRILKVAPDRSSITAHPVY